MDPARAVRMASELGGSAVGGWLVGDLIGSGKSALVVKAERDGRKAALKIFAPDLVANHGREKQESRIHRELTLVDKTHSNLVSVLDGGYCVETGHLFVAMEYLDARNLASMLADVPRGQIAPLMAQVAAAARFLERQGLVHRDIKPENIAIFSDFKRAVLLDLGVVRPVGVDGLTDHEQKIFVGTLRYSSPEYLFRREDDSPEGWRAVTFYQLGAVLHDLIMRKPLFSEFSKPFARLVKAVEEEVPCIEAADVAPHLVALARNCLAKDPEARLRLVDWDAFELAPETDADVESIKNRIRKKQASARHTRTTTASTVGEHESLQKKRAITDIRERILALIQHECADTKMFPPCEKEESDDDDASLSHVIIAFDRSPDLGLDRRLSLWLTVKLLDVGSKAIELLASAALSIEKMDKTALEESARCVVFAGTYDEDSIRSATTTLLYRLLEKAVDAGLAGDRTTEPILLTIDLGRGRGTTDG